MVFAQAIKKMDSKTNTREPGFFSPARRHLLRTPFTTASWSNIRNRRQYRTIAPWSTAGKFFGASSVRVVRPCIKRAGACQVETFLNDVCN